MNTKITKITQHKNLLLLVLFMLFTKFAITQTGYPISVQVQIYPPHSVYLSDYTTIEKDKFAVTLILHDQDWPTLDVRLRLNIIGGGIDIRTSENFMALPITLHHGVPLRLTGAELAQYFNPMNMDFQGISKTEFIQNGSKLPEGIFEFRVRVFEARRMIEISNPNPITAGNINGGSAIVWPTLHNPPMWITPSRNEVVSANNPQNVLFTWLPLHNAAFSVEYEFQIVEIWPANNSPEVVINTLTPLYTEIIRRPRLIYGPDKPLLEPGKKYACRIKAFDTGGASLFKNQGFSEVLTFTFGKPCKTPLNVGHKDADKQKVTIQWDAFPNNTKFVVQYREKGQPDNKWYEDEAESSPYTINKLNPGTTYEYHVEAICGSLKSGYSQVKEFKTEELGNIEYDCGSNPNVPQTDDSPQLEELKVNDIISVGGFQATVTKVSKGTSGFTGECKVSTFWVFPIKAKFENIKVNQSMQVTSGKVIALKTEIPPENIIGEGEGSETETNTNTILEDNAVIVLNDVTVTSIDKDENNNTIITYSDGSTHTVQIGNSATITDKDGNVITVDKDGNVITVDKDGNPIEIGNESENENGKFKNITKICIDKENDKIIVHDENLGETLLDKNQVEISDKIGLIYKVEGDNVKIKDENDGYKYPILKGDKDNCYETFDIESPKPIKNICIGSLDYNINEEVYKEFDKIFTDESDTRFFINKEGKLKIKAQDVEANSVNDGHFVPKIWDCGDQCSGPFVGDNNMEPSMSNEGTEKDESDLSGKSSENGTKISCFEKLKTTLPQYCCVKGEGVSLLMPNNDPFSIHSNETNIDNNENYVSFFTPSNKIISINKNATDLRFGEEFVCDASNLQTLFGTPYSASSKQLTSFRVGDKHFRACAFSNYFDGYYHFNTPLLSSNSKAASEKYEDKNSPNETSFEVYVPGNSSDFVKNVYISCIIKREYNSPYYGEGELTKLRLPCSENYEKAVAAFAKQLDLMISESNYISQVHPFLSENEEKDYEDRFSIFNKETKNSIYVLSLPIEFTLEITQKSEFSNDIIRASKKFVKEKMILLCLPYKKEEGSNFKPAINLASFQGYISDISIGSNSDFISEFYMQVPKPYKLYSYYILYNGEIIEVTPQKSKSDIVGKKSIYDFNIACDLRAKRYASLMKSYYNAFNSVMVYNVFERRYKRKSTDPNAAKIMGKTHNELSNFLSMNKEKGADSIKHGMLESSFLELVSGSIYSKNARKFAFWYRDYMFNGLKICNLPEKTYRLASSPKDKLFIIGMNPKVYEDNIMIIDMLGAFLMPFKVDFIAESIGFLYASYYNDRTNAALYAAYAAVPVLNKLIFNGLVKGRKKLSKSGNSLHIIDNVAEIGIRAQLIDKLKNYNHLKKWVINKLDDVADLDLIKKLDYGIKNPDIVPLGKFNAALQHGDEFGDLLVKLANGDASAFARISKWDVPTLVQFAKDFKKVPGLLDDIKLVDSWNILLKEGDEISAAVRTNTANLEKLNAFIKAEGADVTKLKSSFANAKDAQKWIDMKIPQSELDAAYDAMKSSPLEKLTPWTKEHKAQRWANYKSGNPNADFKTWSNKYDGNIKKVGAASDGVDDYYKTLGWNCTTCKEVTTKGITIMTDDGLKTLSRRHDIADKAAKKAIEVKEYSSGKVYFSENRIKTEVALDAALIEDKVFISIEWVFKGCTPSKPLEAALKEAGIKIVPIP